MCLFQISTKIKNAVVQIKAIKDYYKITKCHPYYVSCGTDGVFYHLLSSFLYVESMAKAPRGAVNTMASTDTVSTVSPHESPKARGIPPIAA